MNELIRADSLFVDEDFKEALSLYTEAVKATGSMESYSHRAACHLKLKKHTQALQDCRKALEMQAAAGKGLQSIVLFRKGEALFALEEYEGAKEAFMECNQNGGGKDKAAVDRFIRKCDFEMSSHSSSGGSSKENAPASSSAAPSSSTTSSGSRIVPSKPAPPKAIQYQYYQTDDKMCVSVLASGVAPADLRVEFGADTLLVGVVVDDKRDATGRREQVVINKELFASVDPAKCTFRIKKQSVELKLCKVAPDHWHSLENTGKSRLSSKSKAAAASAAGSADDVTTAATASSCDGGGDSVSANAAKPPAVPSTAEEETAAAAIPRPYASKKDWNKVESEINAEIEAEKPEGEEALQKLFRDIYSKADPETRKAMNKSMQTSGGTVLSTNWGEVKDKDYEKERQAPKGMEWRSYESGDRLKNQIDNDD
jgi:suppressor of G2 allele of SKP1